MTSSTENRTARTRRVLAAATLAVGGLAAALYGIAGGTGNAQEANCQPATSLAAAMAPLTKGEVAAVSVPSKPALLRDLKFNDPEGRPTTLAALRGKTILLNLWATWCVPCRAEMPALDALQSKFGGSDFQVVTVNIDIRNPDKPKEWLKENNINNLAYYSDPTARIFQDLKSVGKAFGMPTSLILDKSGCELGYLAGPASWASEDAFALIKAAIGKS